MSRAHAAKDKHDDLHSPYSLTKVYERTQGDAGLESLYVASNHKTGERALYSALHNPKMRRDDDGHLFPVKPTYFSTIDWRKARYDSGATSVVKPLTKCLPPFESGSLISDFAASFKLTADSSTLPNKIALKCYTGFTYTTKEHDEARYAESLEHKRGKFATSFTNNNKIFYASEWIKGKSLFDAILDQTLEKVTIQRYLLLFQRYMSEVAEIHRLTDAPLVDIKPENIMAEIENGRIMALHPIDYASVTPGELYTLGYLSRTDITAIYSSSDTKFHPSMASDFRSLSIVFAVGCCNFTRGYLAYIDIGQSATIYQGTYGSNSRTVYGPYDQFQPVVHDIFKQLTDGRNPFTAPSYSFIKIQLQNDIDVAIGHLTKAIDSMPNLTVATDNPLILRQRSKYVKLSIYMGEAHSIQSALSNPDADLTQSKHDIHGLINKLIELSPGIKSKITDSCFYADEYLIPLKPQAVEKAACGR
ncbi:MAG: serine/threonine-protein kinase [Coxiellaceae bacterium]|nr:serine/threonine-protein kinase [Coxiellaceae bacterium]